MKIFNFGLALEPGKYKYKNQFFDQLVEKFSPKKASPYTVEFMDTDLEKCAAVVFDPAKKIDLILTDLERIEQRLPRCEDEKERALLGECQKRLEKEQLICDADFSREDKVFLKTLQLATAKPCLGKDNPGDVNGLIGEVLLKSGIILFFTVVKGELRAWSLEQGLTVLEAAGRIHSDLKRGFIRAEVVNAKELDQFFNLAEARSRGLVKTVDKDYIVEDNDIIEVRFSV